MVNVYFFDSSALVKRYITEAGTSWIQMVAMPHTRNTLIIARITWAEVLSALARRQREGTLLPDGVAKAIRAFRYDIDMQYQVIEIDRKLVEAAGNLVGQHPLRAYDAVQLAALLRVQASFANAKSTSLTFISADDRLLRIAQSEGLLTDNPNHHP